MSSETKYPSRDAVFSVVNSYEYPSPEARADAIIRRTIDLYIESQQGAGEAPAEEWANPEPDDPPGYIIGKNDRNLHERLDVAAEGNSRLHQGSAWIRRPGCSADKARTRQAFWLGIGERGSATFEGAGVEGRNSSGTAQGAMRRAANMTDPSNEALITRLLDTAQLRVPNIPAWLRDDLVLAAETIIELRRQLDAKPKPAQRHCAEDAPLPF